MRCRYDRHTLDHYIHTPTASFRIVSIASSLYPAVSVFFTAMPNEFQRLIAMQDKVSAMSPADQDKYFAKLTKSQITKDQRNAALNDPNLQATLKPKFDKVDRQLMYNRKYQEKKKRERAAAEAARAARPAVRMNVLDQLMGPNGPVALMGHMPVAQGGPPVAQDAIPLLEVD